MNDLKTLIRHFEFLFILFDCGIVNYDDFCYNYIITQILCKVNTFSLCFEKGRWLK